MTVQVKPKETPRLVAFEMLNFMSIKEGRVEFDETGVINLTGYNDSGKSAFSRGVEVLLYDAYANEQVNFIHDGEEMSGLGMEFSDGVSYNKYKYRNGKSVWELMRGDEMLYTNRLADGIAAMSAIPDPIKQYLNVIEDEYTNEKLNVRRNTDKLFLVGMSGGDVYKIINSILHCDTLAETVKRLNEDRNKVQSSLSSKATQLETLRAELKNVKLPSDDMVALLQKRHENLESTNMRLSSVVGISEQHDIIKHSVQIPELQLIDTSRIQAISGVLEAKRRLDESSHVIAPELPLLSTTRAQEIAQIAELRGRLEVHVHPEIVQVDTNRIKELQQIGNLYNELYHKTNAIQTVEAELTQTQAQLKVLSDEHGFKICNNCGTVAV